jgi:hypothetical protein
MTSPLLGLAFAIVRTWTQVYTWRMPPTLREERRAEIESDLWEFEHDATASTGISPAIHVLLRMVSGIPDDLQWRVEQAGRGDGRLRTRIALTATAFFVAAMWMFSSSQPPKLPPPPALVHLFNVRPPPPPPPPPCRAGASTADCPP